MPTDLVVDLGRRSLQEVLIISGPVLAVAIAVSFVVNILQVLTSLQEATISAVPRLLAVFAALFFLMPWMWRQICHFTISILSDFSVYLR